MILVAAQLGYPIAERLSLINWFFAEPKREHYCEEERESQTDQKQTPAGLHKLSSAEPYRRQDEKRASIW